MFIPPPATELQQPEARAFGDIGDVVSYCVQIYFGIVVIQ